MDKTMRKSCYFSTRYHSLYFKAIAVFLFIFVVTNSVAQQYDSESDFIVKIIDNGKSIEIKGYAGSKRTVNIPPTIQGLPVTIIGEYAFGESSLTSITIPNSVTSIESAAFADCASLTSITIPNSVTRIGLSAFMLCTSLTNVNIPNGVTRINGNTFQDCKNLTSITIPNSVTSIGGHAFSHCSSLTSVTIPNSVISIGEGVFSGCTRLKIINISESVTSIENWVFSGCTSLVDINVSSGNANYISEHGILYTKDKTTLVAYPGATDFLIIPNGVSIIGNGAFRESKLTSITIPNSVTNIGFGAFINTSLSNVSIPNSVISIGRSAFMDCFSLTNITIPNSVTNIGDGAFDNCIKLTAINVSANNANYISEQGVLYNKNKTLLHTYPAGKTDSTFIISSTVTSIEQRCFSGCTKLTSITIGNGVTSVGREAFENCINLISVTFQGIIPRVYISEYNAFPGDLHGKYLDGGIGTYTRANGSNIWKKQ